MTEQWRLYVLARWWLETRGQVPDVVLLAYYRSLRP